MTRISTHLRANIVGYVSLFFALSAGAYAAGLAPNSVRSPHIKNGQVKSADIADGSVVGTDVTDKGLTGFDVASNSLSGAQIAESTLGEVPNATIAGHGGYGRQSGGPEEGGTCNPSDGLFFTCASVAMTPSAPGRVLVTGRFTARNLGDETARAVCRLGSSSGGGIPGTTVPSTITEETVTKTTTIVGITDVYQPGNYSFGLDCNEQLADVDIVGARVTAVVISPF